MALRERHHTKHPFVGCCARVRLFRRNPCWLYRCACAWGGGWQSMLSSWLVCGAACVSRPPSTSVLLGWFCCALFADTLTREACVSLPPPRHHYPMNPGLTPPRPQPSDAGADGFRSGGEEGEEDEGDGTRPMAAAAGARSGEPSSPPRMLFTLHMGEMREVCRLM